MPKAISNSLHLKELHVDIPTAAGGVLKGRLFLGDKRKSTCVVLAHPYGPLGGDMKNYIVEALFGLFSSMGYTTLRFNFRGVGGSTGRTSFRGLGEIEDVVTVCNYVLTCTHCLEPPTKLILCGYSYGSVATGAAASQIPQVSAVVSVSYPAGVLWALTLGHQKKHISALQSTPDTIQKFFITGSKDNYTSEASFMQFVTNIPNPKTVVVVPDADHFWVDTEHALISHLNQWVVKVLRAHLGERGSTNELSSGSTRKLSESAQTSLSGSAALQSGYSSGSKTVLSSPSRPVAASPESGNIPSTTKPNSDGTIDSTRSSSLATPSSDTPKLTDTLLPSKRSPLKGPREISPLRTSIDQLSKT
ncbi:hypothetical protein BATDEDRAFT_92264 [Batrachochytrium dendrobatidis JAM81]|uniref:Xaa-Pro dipeptidyl-peptidase-like domain-containing protein n=1 Tax=Batrachochytrium dendrobatidis (strain JAM81 / FGSC 10211) TaxID=684364 RepID=F4PD06_BATDJ|nr:uncharacterized protein BATDEDRAFT_92264 [Batrachochytrium dendrobatidis JAM81]EGF76841.1 hypothetical protein BATDEDRAFT_92264 [Batrachochytrium dendrobatidis JAM81]KAK5672419.1 hypothetical protein QVD99_001182 [Batrachochytrium dendrobatidis]|eukprot:XP_006682475.1 hypothetical protein BATDEDRAFT_92264 [Batrachochytrium dendrobatidis JAM81]